MQIQKRGPGFLFSSEGKQYDHSKFFCEKTTDSKCQHMASDSQNNCQLLRQLSVEPADSTH